MSQEEFESYMQMQEMVRRARWMDELVQLIVGVGLAVGVAVIVLFFVG